MCDLDPKVKVIGKKAGICDGVPSTAALVYFSVGGSDFIILFMFFFFFLFIFLLFFFHFYPFNMYKAHISKNICNNTNYCTFGNIRE